MSLALASAILERLHQAGVAPTGITADSRRVQTGDLFAAWPGLSSDGRKFIGAAVERGAAAVLWDDRGGFRVEGMPVPAIPVAELRSLGGYLAHLIHGCPSDRQWVVGVTGTNGKTTVTQWLAAALARLGEKCGVIGTLGNGFPGQLVDTVNTTPDALEVHRVLGDFLSAGGSAATMEVSSIGLDQERVNAVAFDVAVFTNLSRDHLDYHGTMEAYGAAKARLFDQPGLGCAVINLDDAFGLGLARRLAGAGLPVIGYTQSAAATPVQGVRLLCAQDVRMSASGLRFVMAHEGARRELDVPMVAPFNVSNLLAVAGALLARGLPLDEIVHAIAHLTPPQGRMQLVGGVAEPLVVVDYAHTPDALAKVLESVRATVATRGGRLVCVFGCGGDRDPGKRPLMGEAARDRADRVIVTSDNPRSEDPAKIIDAIMQGAGSQAERVVDRAQAIRIAVAEAGVNDVVVLAGKGHEPYQEILGVRLPFSDVEQAHIALHEWTLARGAGAC
ncbi:UDP-N-acetylmuramoyl-L-alanyl-D-glutamate--2,6-diaminopimelate ligase [Aromatoleum toluclasticum]|uniref:UDP-N-acetylmuramoyl-L-alanyl-D-glutamate--2, 6-diaminopimelate ligase n=1 Tax=Aromatoleum toluclasticum TaxID=92003 RepID=UPI001D17F3D8|nr:UDP-N-acetylmuramoyl-L-alanyl-D-glutamate--2,6-diaminopimelate ligase [Aromatoleum toluclasticum]MCC4117911.1 UDP-N-acetylmuramoyl-L-alanyl-D-glutamate--2,6-diaminopimelate ligase [Aromatoleum toluclasticum]